jgi:hypothetical protein
VRLIAARVAAPRSAAAAVVSRIFFEPVCDPREGRAGCGRVNKILSSIKEDEDDFYMAEGGEDSHKDKYA